MLIAIESAVEVSFAVLTPINEAFVWQTVGGLAWGDVEHAVQREVNRIYVGEDLGVFRP